MGCKKVTKFWVLADEFLDWRMLAQPNEEYDGLVINEDKAYEYVIEQEDFDYDDYLIWYAETHPGSEPMITDILKEKESLVGWFFERGDWRLVRGLELIGGHK